MKNVKTVTAFIIVLIGLSSTASGQTLISSPIELKDNIDFDWASKQLNLNSNQIKTSETWEKEKFVEEAKQLKQAQKRIFIYGIAALSSVEELTESLEGAEKIFINMRLLPQDLSKKKHYNPGIDFSLGINLLNINPESTDRDSLNFISLMFPETGNIGFMAGTTFHLLRWKESGHAAHSLSIAASYSLRQTKIDTGSEEHSVKFSVLNYNAGFQYNFFYKPSDKFYISFNANPYANWFNIPNEDARAFNSLFPNDAPLFEDPSNSFIMGWGVKFSCDINGIVLFGDIRQNRNTRGLSDDNPYKGFVYNVGIAHNLDIFSK